MMHARLINPLRDRILAAVPYPLTEVGTGSLESFLSLPAVENWQPDNMYMREVSSVFDVGLPFLLLTGNATADAHRLEIGKKFSDGERCSQSLMSEVHAGAIFSNWGANVRFVPRQANPTPDIECSWGDEQVLDVEVTRAEMRQLHAAVHRGLEALLGALQPGDVAWNVTGFIADASNPECLNAMFQAAISLQPDQWAEDAGKWLVRAVPLPLRDDVLGSKSVETFGPNWWPSGEPSFFSTGTLLGAAGNPVVCVRSLVPLTSYMNPLRRKADSGQRSGGNPYLIALDVSELPRAHERIVEELQGFFTIWDHVSAVLLFEQRFWIGVDRKEWLVSLHRNSTAAISLSPHLAALPDRERQSIAFTLSQRPG